MKIKNGKIILLCYAVFFAAAVYFGVHFSEEILSIRPIDLANYLLVGVFPLKSVIGTLIALLITLFLWFGKEGYYRAELDAVIEEIKKVTIPTKDETRVTTISVFVFVAIMIVVFFILDLIWSHVSLLIY